MMEPLTIDDIKDMFTTIVYSRGYSYYREGRVSDLYHDTTKNMWSAKVKGSRSYLVTIEEDEDEISSECNCPAFNQYWEPCKHIAAVMLEIYSNSARSSNAAVYNQFMLDRNRIKQENFHMQQQEIEKQNAERQAIYVKQLTNQFIQNLSSYAQENSAHKRGVKKSPLQVEWIIKLNHSYYAKSQLLSLEMKVGQKRTYVVKKIKAFLNAVKFQTQYPFTKHFTYDPTEQEFTQEDRAIIDLLLDALKFEEAYQKMQSDYYRGSGWDERALMIPPMIVDQLLNHFAKEVVRFETDGKAYDQINLYQSDLPFSIQLDKGGLDGFQLDLSELLTVQHLDLYGFIMSENNFYKISDEQQLLIQELKKLMNRSHSPLLPIANDQIEPFISQVAPRIGKIGKMAISDKVSNDIVKFPLQAKLYVERMDDLLHVTLAFHYGEHKINPFEEKALDNGAPIIMRDAEKEQAIMDEIETTSIKLNGKQLYVEGEAEIFAFLYEILPQLEDKTEILLTNAVKSFILPNSQAPVTNIDVDSSGNWLEVNFDMAGIDQEEVKNILQSVVEKKKYYRLPSGAFVSLESEELQMMQNVLDEFKIQPSQLEKETIQLPIYRGMQLDEIVDKENGSYAKYGKQFRRLLNRLKNPEELEFDVPDSLQAELRDYQYFGFQWLKTLKYYRLGGILADDMGLGKTLQCIAYILSEKLVNKDNMKPTLVVAPASLVYNWKNEFQKFAPELTVEVIIGNPQERVENLQSELLPDVWITSYPTLRQDIDTYRQLTFSTLILDEAQAIKNHTTKTAKAIRDVQAETCFALSGTPIENSIDELWSIFQTVIPNFFPNQKAFRQLEPVKVAKMIRPFLLRRVKKDVLKELPDKIETVTFSELTNQQKNLYLAYLERIQKESKESIQGEGFQKSRMKILAGLTRLRQLCCHPSLFLDDYNGDSGKLQQLVEIVSNGMENGRRMLIFSQFTSMLSIIREQLTNAGLDFFYLDGQTAPKERVNMVDQFNQGEADIFLISLKAGNTGLNLTGADTVILYDLWWNPAVEEQAAGRAHRIGQKNVVQVIRLITQGTIEEKIYELQQNKKELIETVVKPGEESLSRITEEEIREILNI
ncbi:DEAD/DEAH box helicase [Aquibacillus koreensis]|uniref:DEAD/DEAH box helicase n=1 Tax=Aquibacillus koreensis TaxID=279446 RepID=A0A9X4AH78_9BACI|nr:DEAD/DEAH box helicase [Aquibacillus koreensis]MCT2534694.1 DEAD/DEAH box helicase [Aquibacillus koreensis]MDC3419696.1 DEAD/DEAH box helicase [Aquibacillus koreensis]